MYSLYTHNKPHREVCGSRSTCGADLLRPRGSVQGGGVSPGLVVQGLSLNVSEAKEVTDTGGVGKVNMNSAMVGRVDNFKYLSVTIHEDLTWAGHITATIEKTPTASLWGKS